MDNIISQNDKKIKNNQRYIPHLLETRFYAVKTYRNCNSVSFVCRRYKISKACLISFCGILLIELDKIKENTNNFKKIFLVEFLKILTGVILGTIIGIYIIAIIFYF